MFIMFIVSFVFRHYLRQEGHVLVVLCLSVCLFVCLSVCLSVSNLAQDFRINGFT